MGSFFYIHVGSIQILTNAIVYISTKVPTVFAPAVTTYCALLLNLIVVFQLAVFASVHYLGTTKGLLLVAAYTLLPATFEVFLNATNIQWITGVSILIYLTMPTDWIERHWKLGAAWSFVCGLSGVPATILTPLFLLRALVERSLPIAFVATVLGLSTVIQLAILAHFGGGATRSYLLEPSALFVPLLLQSVISPLLSADVGDWLGRLILSQNSRVAALSLIGTLEADR